MARLVDAPAPALHGLAPLLRRDRGLARPPRRPVAPGGHRAGVLPGGRPGRARLDELHGRPLRTEHPGRRLVAATVVSLAGAVALGVAGVCSVGVVLVPFIVVGPLLVVAYNAELFGGVVHTDAGFAPPGERSPCSPPTWPRRARSDLAPVLAAAGAFALRGRNAALAPRRACCAVPCGAWRERSPSPTGPSATSTTVSFCPARARASGDVVGASHPGGRAGPGQADLDPGKRDTVARPQRVSSRDGGVGLMALGFYFVHGGFTPEKYA